MEAPPARTTHLPWDTSAGNRFAHYSFDDHSGPLWIATLLGVVYVLGVLLLRVYIKRRVFGWDDYLITTGSITALGQFVVIGVALRSGLGRVAASIPHLKLVGDLSFSSRVLYLVSIYLAKFSVLAILSRIFVRDKPQLKVLCNLAFGLFVISGLVSILVDAVGCPSSGYFTDGHCESQITRWSIVTGLDVATEAVLVLLPPYMVCQLQMKAQNKLRIIVAFCFRISVIVLSIFHLNAWIDYTRGPPSPLRIAHTLIWQQALIAMSLISATIPNLKAFLQSLSSRWGEADMRTYAAYATGTYELRSIHSVRPTEEVKVMATGALRLEDRPRLDVRIHATETETGDGESLGSTRGSQDLIIRKETTFAVVRT